MKRKKNIGFPCIRIRCIRPRDVFLDKSDAVYTTLVCRCRPRLFHGSYLCIYICIHVNPICIYTHIYVRINIYVRAFIPYDLSLMHISSRVVFSYTYSERRTRGVIDAGKCLGLPR